MLLKDIWPIADLREYKIHFAVHNGKQQPLEGCPLTRGKFGLNSN